MKKILIRLAMFLLLFSNVYAKENRLYINGNGKNIFYESKYFDKDVFLNHTDMVPGEEYTDELVIENKSNKELEIILKLKDESAYNTLLGNVNVVITLDDNLIYDDSIQVGGASDGDINLGKFSKGDKSILKVKSKLSDDYNPSSGEVYSINWSFYINDNNKSVPLLEGSTFGDIMRIIVVLLLIILAVILAIIGFKLFTVSKSVDVLDDSDYEADKLVRAEGNDTVEVLNDNNDNLEVLTEEDESLEIVIPSLNYKISYDDARDVIDSKSKLPSEDGNLILNIHIDRINELKSDDIVYVIYNKVRYTYKLLNIYNIEEDGFVEVDNTSAHNTLTIMDINKDGIDYIAIFYLA